MGEIRGVKSRQGKRKGKEGTEWKGAKKKDK